MTGKLDPNDILGRYVSDYAKNFMKYNNPDYDKLIEEAKTASDEERVELFKECQKMLTDDAAEPRYERESVHFKSEGDAATNLGALLAGIKLD